MIGKPVSIVELARALASQAERYKLMKQLGNELKAIKPGECLFYEVRPETPLWADIGFHLAVCRVKGLKIVRVDNGIYVYRGK